MFGPPPWGKGLSLVLTPWITYICELSQHTKSQPPSMPGSDRFW